MKINYKILFAGMILLLFGCENMAPEIVEDPHGSENCTPQFPGMDVTWDNYVKNVIADNCVVCHQGGNSPGTGNFTSYAGVKVHLDHFYLRVIQDRADMPQGNAPLPKTTRDSLNIWISNCAPEN